MLSMASLRPGLTGRNVSTEAILQQADCERPLKSTMEQEECGRLGKRSNVS